MRCETLTDPPKLANLIQELDGTKMREVAM